MIDNILHNRLLDIMSATDEEMRPNQRYNIPHFVDMKLQLYKKLYKLNSDSGHGIYGYQYTIGNFYADDVDVDNSDMGWKDKVYMNINMGMSKHLYTPFIVFAKQEDGAYAAINTNNVSVYKTIHAKAYLILQGETYYPPEDLKILLIPFGVDYHCTDMNEENYYVYSGTTFNMNQYGGLWNPALDDMPYESIRMRFGGKVKMFAGEIKPNDVAIRINGIPYGSKVYTDNILLFNLGGELVYDSSIYLTEKENNIFEINNNVSMIGWRYIAFYNTEADASLSNIYSVPEYIIDHDSIVRITGEGKYLLGEENFKAMIDLSNSLTAEDIRSLYASHTNDTLMEYNDFLNDWLDRIVKYRKKLVDDLINKDEVNVYKEFTFYSVSYTLNQLKSKAVDGEAVFHRVMWRMYDNTSYSGYCDILLFINGLLRMEYINYDWDSKEYHILVEEIEEDLGNDISIEFVYITNVRDKSADIVIPFGKNNEHVLYADRYYEPRLSNFFTITPEPMVHIQNSENCPLLRQPLNFTYNKIEDGKYNIQFEENWIKISDKLYSDLNVVSVHDKLMETSDGVEISDYDISDIIDNSSNRDFTYTTPYIVIDSDVDISGIVMIPQVRDSIAYISGDHMYANDGEVIEESLFSTYSGISMYCDNFVKNKLALLTITDKILEFDGDNLKSGIENVIDLSVLESSVIDERVRKDIVVPFDCSATYIPEKDMVVVLENGFIAEGDTPRVMLIAMEDIQYLNSITRILPERIRTIGSKIIPYSDHEIIIYGGSENYHDTTNKVYIYDINTEALTFITTIPDNIGMAECALWYNSTDTLYVFGGLNTSINTKSASTIAMYNFTNNTWDYVETDHVFIASALAESENSLALVGGYKSRAIDINNIKDDIIVFDKSKMNDKEYLKNIQVTSKAPDAIVDGRSINDLKRSDTFIVGTRNTSYESTVYKLDVDSGLCLKFNMPSSVEYDWNDIVSINYNSAGTALYIQSIGDIQYAFSKIVSFDYHGVKSLFIDTYGIYHALVNNHIYSYENGSWVLIADVTRINKISPIKKIQLSGSIFVALLEDGRIITSPNLDVWYWYNFNAIEGEIDDIRFTNGEHPVSVIHMLDGSICINPYTMNMSSYYGNYIRMASKNRFACQVEYIDPDDNIEVIDLSSDFEYCLDPDHFMVFYNGKLLERDTYEIVLPSLDTPINKSSIYPKFEIEEECVITVVYLTFDTNIIHREDHIPNNGIVTIRNTELFNKYGLGRNFYWLFSHGRKIAYNNLMDISNNMIQIKDTGHLFDDIDKDDIATDEKTEIITLRFSNIDENNVEYDVNRVMCYKNNSIVKFTLDIEATLDLNKIMPDDDIEIEIDGIKPFTESTIIGEVSPLIGFKDTDDIVFVQSIAGTTKIKLCTAPDGNISYIKYLNINNTFGGNIIILSDITAQVEATIEHRYNALCIVQTAELFNNDEFDIDEFNTMMDYFINTLTDFGIDTFYVENIRSIKDMEASIEDKVILLRVYADHYVANKDRYGNTPTFELDKEYPIYPVLNGN